MGDGFASEGVAGMLVRGGIVGNWCVDATWVVTRNKGGGEEAPEAEGPTCSARLQSPSLIGKAR